MKAFYIQLALWVSAIVIFSVMLGLAMAAEEKPGEECLDSINVSDPSGRLCFTQGPPVIEFEIIYDIEAPCGIKATIAGNRYYFPCPLGLPMECEP